MSSNDLGKKFEDQFKQQWSANFPKTFIFRLKDQMTGYKETSGNPCDFICSNSYGTFMVECKEHKGASIPFTAIPQYERLLQYKGLENTYPGVIVWFSEKDLVIWVSIYDMEKLVNSGHKSISCKIIDDPEYSAINIPSIKKRTFMESNYQEMVKLLKAKEEEL